MFYLLMGVNVDHGQQQVKEEDSGGAQPLLIRMHALRGGHQDEMLRGGLYTKIAVENLRPDAGRAEARTKARATAWRDE